LKRIFIITILSFLFAHSDVTAQGAGPSLSFDLKKPPKFENKTLGSEKTGNKKFTATRRFLQNTFTHYNYYFNANNRLNEIVARAKNAQKDDYTELLPFYSYSLKATSAYKTDLDSVIYKSTAGILIHDLRNDWIDNLYLLIGKAYYLRNDPDSAFLTFQYINFAFSPKEKDGYDKVIGSNSTAGSNAFSISTKEHRNIIDKAFSEAPSRNESLVWQVKTYLSKDRLAEASGLIETLKHDPLFPERLDKDLEEVQAHWFYKQQNYDSAAVHLEKALGNADGNQERARWEYLIAQLYEKSGKHLLAEKFYNKAIQHTINPVLEVYARLNAIRQNKNGSQKEIQEAIDALINMARKDKYLFYRDIIYYTAAVIENERNNPEAAKVLLLKSIKTSANNPAQKNKSFMALGDLTFKQKQYKDAKRFYDSVEVQTVPLAFVKDFTERKNALDKIVKQLGVLERQDSLQRIAAMPALEREVFLKKLAKTLRRQQGIKDDDNSTFSYGNLANNNAPDLFGNSSKGDWYFSNAALKSKGLGDFKVKWGNRPNADNWRRQSATANASLSQAPRGKGFLKAPEVQAAPIDISFEGLQNNVPLTPEKLKISQDSVESSLFEVGKAYMNGLEDYLSAITAFEKLLTDFPATFHAEEAWYNLYYCYLKTGNPANQARVKQLLASKFPGGKFTGLLSLSKMSQSPDSILKKKATVQYEGIYNQFIEGKFDEAVKSKKIADSMYGKSFWTPQLLFIESVYYIRQQKDSVAKSILGNILQLFPTTPIYDKTVTMLEVLSRRKQIEDYLTKLDLKKLEESVAKLSDDKPMTLIQGAVVTPPKVDSSKILEAQRAAAVLKAQKELADAKIAKELKEKIEREEKEALALKARKDKDEKEAAALKAKKEQEEKLAAIAEIKRKEAEAKAAKELQTQKDAAELAAKQLQEKKDIAEKAAKELQAQKELADKAAKESKEKKQLDSAIAAKELEMKKQADEIATRELLAKKEQAAIAAKEKTAKDLAEKERLAKQASDKKALALAEKELALKTAKDKKAQELADKAMAKKELADKKASDIAAKRMVDSAAKKDIADKKAKDIASKILADSIAKQDLANKQAARPAPTDSSQIAKVPHVTSLVYSNKPSDVQYVVLVLDKVDPVYATEARNAFNRYHRESFNDKNITTTSFSLTDDTKLLVINPFDNATAALSYIEKTQKLTQTDIIPWLTAQKYSFLLISASNLDILKNTKDVASYRKYLKELYPGKF
jgi:DNA polymerase III delta prime subunit